MSNPFAAFARPGVEPPTKSTNLRKATSRSRRPGSGKVQRLGAEDARRVRVGQIVLDASAVVKELIENALDAKATRVSVRIAGAGGCGKIEVVDNGSGVDEEDWEGMCRLGETSKNGGWDGDGGSFGFRGEALGGVCGLAKAVVVVTRTAKMNVGQKLVFGNDGQLVAKEEMARGVGTTITVEELFEKYPVRKRDAESNSAREIGKAIAVVSSFAIGTVRARIDLRVEQKVKIMTTGFIEGDDLGDKMKVKNMVLKNIASVLGGKASKSLIPCEKDDLLGKNSGYSLAGFVSQPRLFLVGRSSSSSHFFFINERPVELSRLSRALNEVYRRHSPGNCTPTAVIRFQVPVDACDINLSPDKRQIALAREDDLVQAVQEIFDELWKPQRTQAIPVQSMADLMETSRREARASTNGRRPEIDTLTQLYSLRKKRKGEQTVTKNREEKITINEQESKMDVIDSSMGTDIEDSDADDSTKENVFGSKKAPHSTELPRPEQQAVKDAQPTILSRKKVQIEKESVDENLGRERSPDDTVKKIQRHDTTGERPLRGGKAKLLTQSFSSGTLLTKDPISSIVTRRDSHSRGKHIVDPPIDDMDDDSGVDKTDRVYDELIKDFSSDEDEGAVPRTSKKAEKTYLPHTGGKNVATKDPVSPAMQAKKKSAHVRGIIHRNVLPGPEGAQKCSCGEECSRTHSAANLQGSETNEDAYKHAKSFGSRPRRLGRAVLEVESSGINNTSISVEDDDPVIMFDHPRPKSSSKRPVGAKDVRVIAEMPKKVRFDLDSIRRSLQGQKKNPVSAKDDAGNSSKGKSNESLRFANSSLQPANNQEASKIGHETEGERIAAETELTRVFQRDWFQDMRVVGQFNLGFIVCALDGNLFIVDQHASDEKFNFELLQRTTSLQTQRLVHPKPLEFSAEEEILVAENLNALKAGGFEISYEPSKPPTERMKLLSVPFSKNIVFDIHDVEEIVANLKSNAFYSSKTKVLRPRRVRDMFASRSCRMSVMIGTALEKAQMKRIVSHLTGLDHPWTCPHGRPTMRHLCDLGGLEAQFLDE